MVRNWQARVEQADVRRKQAKQKKQYTDDKRLWKLWFNECIKNQLDTNILYLQQLSLVESSTIEESNRCHNLQIHIWTDVAPNYTSTITTKDTQEMNHEDDAIHEDHHHRHHKKSITTSSDDDEDEEEDIVPSKKDKKGRNRPKSQSMGNDNDVKEEKGGSNKRRNRSNSHGNSVSVQTPSSLSSSKLNNSKKKVHPRSKEAITALPDSHGTSGASKDNIHMCRSYFFTGSCDFIKNSGIGSNSSGKKSYVACRHVHPMPYNNSKHIISIEHDPIENNRTLYDVLSNTILSISTTTSNATPSKSKSQMNHHEQLVQSARAEMIFAEKMTTINNNIAAATVTAIKSSSSATTPTSSSSGNSTITTNSTSTTTNDMVVVAGGMNMVYYVNVLLQLNNDSESIPSEQIIQSLSNQNLFISNVVYMTCNNILIYDRYQDGMIYTTNETFLMALFGTTTIPSILQCKRDQVCIDPNDVELLVHMPTTILEHICSYLVDESVVSMTQVCTSWYNEIGIPNARLWQMLLIRHNWPCNQIDTNGEVNMDSYRCQFQKHYSISRDMKELQKGYDYLLQTKRNWNSISKSNLAIYDYTSRQHAPVNAVCVAVKEWSPRHLLIAMNDCTLRLYETRQKSLDPNSSAIAPNENHCRELICYRIDPYRHSRKKVCTIITVVLDDTYITSLCHIRPTIVCSDSYLQFDEILVSLRRDDFLLGESNTGNILSDASQQLQQLLKIFNLTDAIFKYMLNEDDCPNHLRTLEVEFGDRFTTKSHSISSCRSGLVLISSVMLIYNKESPAQQFAVGTRIFLICLNKQQIVWSNDCSQLQDNNSEYRNQYIGSCSSCYRSNFPTTSSSRVLSDFVVASRSPNVENVMVGVVEPSGIVSGLTVVNIIPRAREIIVADEARWRKDVFNGNERKALMTLNDIVIVDVWEKYNALDERVSSKTVVTFYPRKYYISSIDETSFDVNCIEITENLEVQRLSLIQDTYLIVLCLDRSTDDEWDATRGVSVVIDIPSRREIGRFDWNRVDDASHLFLPNLITMGHGTMGFELYNEGVIITGNDIRHHGVSNDDEFGYLNANVDLQQFDSSSKKKKKKPVRSKKDSFRTHNGDRCY